MVRCMILVPTPVSFSTMDVPRVSAWSTESYWLTPDQLSFMTKCNRKKIIFISLGCQTALGNLSQSGDVRILNCNMNFVKLKCILLSSVSYIYRTRYCEKGNKSGNALNVMHLPVRQISFWPLEFSREKVIFPHIWDTTSWFLHKLICFFI